MQTDWEEQDFNKDYRRKWTKLAYVWVIAIIFLIVYLDPTSRLSTLLLLREYGCILWLCYSSISRSEAYNVLGFYFVKYNLDESMIAVVNFRKLSIYLCDYHEISKVKYAKNK